jgi:hypothetical protein
MRNLKYLPADPDPHPARPVRADWQALPDPVARARYPPPAGSSARCTISTFVTAAATRIGWKMERAVLIRPRLNG